MRKNKKYLLYIIAILFLITLGLGIYNYKAILGYVLVYPKYLKAISEAEQRYKENLQLKEAQFKENENLKDAGTLMLTYHNPGYPRLRDIDKALYYGKKCIELGIENAHTDLAVTVNFHIALIYKEKKNKDMARYHLKKALDLDKNDEIRKSNAVEDFDLQDIWDKKWGAY